MESKYYFKKTFVFVFIFSILYKTIGMMFERFEGFDLQFVVKTVVVSSITALVLGGINAYAKIDFLNKKK